MYALYTLDQSAAKVGRIYYALNAYLVKVNELHCLLWFMQS